MATVNRQFLPGHWIPLRCRCCSNRAVVSPTKSQLTFSVANTIAVRISPSRGYIIASRFLRHDFCNYCCDIYVPHIMYKFIPGSPPPVLIFVGVRGEPENEANCTNNVDNCLAMKKTTKYCCYRGSVSWRSQGNWQWLQHIWSHVSNHLSPPVYCQKPPVSSDTPFPQN